MSRFVTRVFDRFFTPRMPEPYAGPSHRWLVGALLGLVMVIFPGLGFLSALIGLADVIAGRPVDPIGDYSLFVVVADIAFTAVLITMVWGFLRLCGDRLMRIGMLAKPAGQTARETSWAFVWLFVVCGVIAIVLDLAILQIPNAERLTADVQIGADVSFVDLALVGIPASICAGLLEEIVVLGFAFRMLERLGLSDRAILIILVTLRISFHLYYGLTAIVLLPWAFVSVIFYRRYRRLWPLIIGHAAWDIYAFLGSASVAAEVIGLAVMVLLTITAIIVAIVRWLRARRGPLLTLQIPRPRPAWIGDPAAMSPWPRVEDAGRDGSASAASR